MPETIPTLILLCPGFEALDLFGPHSGFSAANELAGHRYLLSLTGFDRGVIPTESGIGITVDNALDPAWHVHTLIIAGGAGPRARRLSATERRILGGIAGKAARVASVCTGAFILAQLDVAKDRRLTTHWRHAHELRSAYPQVQVADDELYVRDGKIWSSAGVTAGIDMALAMIDEDCGGAVAAAVARQLVVYLRRPGDQSQFSEPLNAQSVHAGRLGELLSWIADNLDADLDIETLAARASVSARQLTRLFNREIGASPARYIERLRLDRARLILAAGEARIDAVASAVGYRSDDVFRRAFERRFAVPPSTYRAGFSVLDR